MRSGTSNVADQSMLVHQAIQVVQAADQSLPTVDSRSNKRFNDYLLLHLCLSMY